MSQVKQVAVRILTLDKQDSALNFSNCYNIEYLNFDFGVTSYEKFKSIIFNFFNKKKTDLILPHIFKEESTSSDDDENYGYEPGPPPNNRSGARSHSQEGGYVQEQPLILQDFDL